MQPFSLLRGTSLLLIAGTSFGVAVPQDAAKPPSADGGSTMGAGKPAFKPEELDQMLAPIALHPDDLLSQILMASTYPVELVQADRWVKANPKLKGDALAKELEKQSWDPSVRSLVNFPQVLTMMSEKLDWTVNVGNAFLGQQKQVMETIQKLRAKAKEAGNLESSKEQKVSTETQEGQEVIVIEPTDPDVVYVPVYNTTVVYGPWWYPAYPPWYWYPPAYVPPPHPGCGFGVGVSIGVAWGYAWGHCGWGHCNVDVDVNRNTNINTNINRNVYAQQLNASGVNKGVGTWQHAPAHRAGVAYRDSAATTKYGGAGAADAAKSREAFRGRSDAAPGNLDSARNLSPSATNRPSTDPPSNRPETDRPSSNRPATDRPSTGRGNGFDGVGDGGSSARAASSRGNSSRASSPSPAAQPRGGGRGGGRRG